MTILPDFEIRPEGEISKASLAHDIHSFHEAIDYIRNLPYGRNPNKDDLKTVFTDGKATCGTKHALLKTLADENSFQGLILTLGLFKMNGRNTPAVRHTLELNKLDFIPEAHVYLKYENEILDFTRPNSKASDFENDLIQEQVIFPNQINQSKIELHKKFLAGWLEKQNGLIPFSLEELWKIREQCIQDLSNHPGTL